MVASPVYRHTKAIFLAGVEKNMTIKIKVYFDNAQKAQIISTTQQTKVNGITFEMSLKFAALLPEFKGEYSVNNDYILVYSDVQLVRDGHSVILSNMIVSQIVRGELKLGDNIDLIMYEFAYMIESDRIETDRKLREQAEADKLREYTSPLRKWEEYNSSKISSRELAIADANAQAEADRLEAEKLAWIKQHGSIVLRKSMKHGYNCQKQYVIERSTLILGDDYILDYDGKVNIKDRSCPTLEALEEVEKHNFCNHTEIKQIKVTWLPCGLMGLNTTTNHFKHSVSGCEAVRVRFNDLKGYWYRTF